jgi:hypothetical protein
MAPNDRRGFLYILLFAAFVYAVARLCVMADPHPPFHRLGMTQNQIILGTTGGGYV